MGVRSHRLVLVPVGHRSWRLCDMGTDHHERPTTAAYVEQTASGYTVNWVCRPGAPAQHFSSPSEILEVAESLIAEGESGGPRRPTPIPHIHPPRH